jgi:hypothetical protein
MTPRQRGDLTQLFGTAALGPTTLNPAKAERVLLSSRYQMTLRALLIGADGPLRTGKGRVRYERLTKRVEAHTARRDLLTTIDAVRQLKPEAALLRAEPPGTKRVPATSRTGTAAWSVYASALKAAATWWAGKDRGWKFAERELATRALGGSKLWTGPSKAAFSRLIGEDFHTAVHTSDTGVRIQGPGAWRLNRIVADFDHDIPFLEIPGRTAAENGHFTHHAAGILLIENQETFEAAHRTSIRDSWLRIWIEGFVSEALVHLFTALPPLPLAIWTDLDPPGIDIITNLGRRIQRPLHPIAMDPATYAQGFMLEEPPEKRREWQSQAEEQARTGPPALRPLAAAIAANDGQRCEQESLHEYVLPRLASLLHPIAESHDA